MQAPRNPQVQHEPKIILQSKGNALADAPHFPHGFPFSSLERWDCRAEQERACDADTLQRLINDARFQGFDVNNDVGKFRHDFAILP